ncbi:histidinol dehydrogenase [Halodesulfurarchaeum formicicum]|uniref:Histidinol dehydrogenase n=1 Tax=Halodesulfurarchaeum formicicum TaxID=1873524 RepID=A0A1D8S313_9EURY|nr:histidinol dehydrogenase [Halodesulfurarchaeum formicicum]
MQLSPMQLSDLDADRRKALVDRDSGVEAERETVREIIEQVRADGDAALKELSSRFDGVEVESIEVTARIDEASATLDADIKTAIETAAANIREFHAAEVPDDWRADFDGRELGRRFRPLDRVGIYAPGGTAAYPSSVLMGVIPAKVAGVEEVVVATPPAEEIHPATLYAADVAGADAVYQIGGAQAIAALAYGTESVEPVQKIAGPGNRFVTAAKAEVQGDAAIDFLAGPSELLAIADDTADPAAVAADMLAQAEHDPDSSVVAITDDAAVADSIRAAIDAQIPERNRAETIEAALDGAQSAILVADSLSAAATFAEAYAAEHLSIQTADDEAVLDAIDSAGSVFLGHQTPVAAGDYATGTNHVLPTGGQAKIVGGLSVDTFLRATTVQRLDEDSLSGLADTIRTLATTEGLDAHEASVSVRLED